MAGRSQPPGGRPGARSGLRPGSRPAAAKKSTQKSTQKSAQKPAESSRQGAGVPRPRSGGPKPPAPRPRNEAKPEPPKPKAQAKPKPKPVKRRTEPRRLRLGSGPRRLRVGFVLIAMLMSVFAGRLLVLQGVEASEYATKATIERQRTITLLARRGDITDASGVSLATTVDSVAVTADPKLTAPKAGKIAKVLAPLLKVPEAELRAKLAKSKTSKGKWIRFVYLARKVYPDVWDKASTQLEKADLSGVFQEPDPIRVYPAGTVASNIVGFVNDEGKGGGGLEYALNTQLSGKPGKEVYERGAGGRQIPLASSSEEAAVQGSNVKLTIDRDVQWAAQQAIAEQVKKTKAQSGDVVVMDVKTGQIVAMATAPGYDPNHVGKSKDADRKNRPLEDIYEPGSVAKVITASALIDSGYVSGQTKIDVPGTIMRGGKRIKDYWAHGNLHLTFAGAIAKSSNVGTVLAAEKMPKQVQADYLAKFGIGQPTGIGFPGGSKGLLAPAEDWGRLERATISFGQGMAANAVQMTSVVATIANGGVRVQPTLIKGATDGSGTYVPSQAPKRTHVVSEATAKEVTAMMEAVTAPDGAAHAAAIPGYRVAGKTGTAQRVDPDCSCYRGYTTSFAGFAPAESPRFVAYVDLQDPQGDATGSSTAAPVFSQVMSFALHKYGVAPGSSKSPDVPLTW
ncbi:peptidoglycan D,D-transpeptidase FtsI family protein [Flindersiella endophytica]